MGGLLLALYVATMAPGVTFWDAGEFIAAAHTLGIPHPPGTPLFVALGRVWTLVLGGALGVARASNLLSAVSTAGAGVVAAEMIARAAPSRGDVTWGAIAGALCAGVMSSVWANATETEVYAVSLLHVALMLRCAQRASDADEGDVRLLLCTAYLIALAPGVHLSALVGAPAAILLASRRPNGEWCSERILLLGGVLVSAAGVGRMSWVLAGCGAVIAAASIALPRGKRASRRTALMPLVAAAMLTALAASAVLIMLVRARHDPAVNQGNPSTLHALADVVARRQYDVAPMWPRRAPAWLQFATLLQYVDWQFALSWGRGIFTSPARVLATAFFLLVGASGWRAMRRDVPRVAEALALLTLCGTLGVGVYLNLKAGATLGYGFVPAEAHEARERDYFFVLGFWGWGLFVGYGALAFTRRGLPPWAAPMVAFAPLLGNWTASDRRAADGADAPRDLSVAMLTSTPRGAMLFVAGDNDTYPLWYLQRVEGMRTDVTVVTMPLLPADWYVEEVARRTGLRWPSSEHVEGARWQHEERAALIARAARAAGWPIAVSTGLPASERRLLGSGWRLRGATYLASAPASGSREPPTIDSLSVPPAWKHPAPGKANHARMPDDVSAAMLSLLECARLGVLSAGRSATRDSLEVNCNFR